MTFFTTQPTFRFISGLVASLFLLVFVFGCIVSTTQNDMDCYGATQDGYSATMPTGGHINDHMTIALSLPQTPERGIVLTLIAFVFLAIASALSGAILAHSIFQKNPYLRKERVFLYNPAISLFRTGIVHPKIF